MTGAGRGFQLDLFASAFGGHVELAKRPSAEEFARFAAMLEFVRMDLSQPGDYAHLAACLQARNADTVVMYVATAPSLFTTICEQLGASGLNTPHTRVVLEKPLGHDLASNRAINRTVRQFFEEKQVFRMVIAVHLRMRNTRESGEVLSVDSEEIDVGTRRFPGLGEEKGRHHSQRNVDGEGAGAKVVQGGQSAKVTGKDVDVSAGGRDQLTLPSRMGLKVFHPGIGQLSVAWDGDGSVRLNQGFRKGSMHCID